MDCLTYTNQGPKLKYRGQEDRHRPGDTAVRGSGSLAVANSFSLRSRGPVFSIYL
jgi:hypothetical protein